MDPETKNVVGLLVNLVLPGLGTVIWGEANRGVLQLVLFLIGAFSGIGFLLAAGVWIWALVNGIQRLAAKKQ